MNKREICTIAVFCNPKDISFTICSQVSFTFASGAMENRTNFC